jgi:K+-transporting ATPase ATPase A chain
MSSLEIVQIVLYLVLLVAITPLLGGYMKQVFDGERNILTPVLRPIERLIYRLSSVRPEVEQPWKEYTLALLAFNILGFLLLLGLQLLQGVLPLNPEGRPGVEPWLAFNAATSFMTNTNWQSYAGETTMSQLTQMLGLGVQNFVSAATGMAVVIALTRGLARRSAATLGNFWADLVRATLYILLPLALILAVILVSQGVVQNFDPNVTVTTLAGETQALPQGPAASQIAIKQLGSNGGGFFNANSAHPYENPTPLTNFLQMFALLAIACGADQHLRPHGRFAAPGLGHLRRHVHPDGCLAGGHAAGRDQRQPRPGRGWGNGGQGDALWRGQQRPVGRGHHLSLQRLGQRDAQQFLSPLAGGVALLNMLLGEVIFGGVGAGLYGMLVFVILTVFIAGLMVGRTPEYLGKKIEAREVQMATLAILLPAASILLLTALAVGVEVGLSSRLSAGPHGFSEILYAYTSATANNGSAFAGLNANTPFYNITDSAWRCGSAASASSSPSWRSPAAWSARRLRPPRWAPSRLTSRSSPGCSSAWSSSSAR